MAGVAGRDAGRVAGKVALITGGASGLGLADAEALAAEGARVVITDVNEEAGNAAADRIGANTIFLKHDVTSEEDWQRVIATTAATFGKLDVLVNNAGVVVLASPEETTLEQFRFVNAIMNEGVFLGCKYAIPEMKKTGNASIINMSSIASHVGYPVFFAYSAAKGAVRSMTKSIAVHCQSEGYGIRCNSIHAGAIETPMIQSAQGRGPQDVPTGPLPVDGVGAPSDVASMVVYLASDESRFVTGAEMLLDNGLSIQ